MKSVDSRIYDKKYFLKVCGGHEEFSKGIIPLRLKTCMDLIQVNRGDTVLDAGCGRGELSIHYALKGVDVVGIDYSEASIHICNKLYDVYLKRLKGQLIFLRADVKDIPFSDNSFDKIFCLDLIEHLYPEEQKEMLKEFKRLLKPGGVLLIHTLPNRLIYDVVYPVLRIAYPVVRHIPIFKGFVDTAPTLKGLKQLPKNPRSFHEIKTHVSEQTKSSLKRMLIDSGFKPKINLIFQTRTRKSKIINLLGYILERIPLINSLFCIEIISIARVK